MAVQADSFVLPVDKPVGPTSHDIVAIARRALGTRRIGHTGTLDPFASGLLLLCINNATRLAEYLTDLPKRYRALARFDGATTTDDCTGDFISTSDSWRALDERALRDAFERQGGVISQRPSSYSAKKIAGERAYAIARRGEQVDLSPIEVTIYDIRILAMDLPEVAFEVDCSSGTYVRAIARDVGAALGTGGHLKELRRLAIGKFDGSQAIAPEALTDVEQVTAARLSMVAAIAHLPRLDVAEADERALRFGQIVSAAAPPGIVAVTRATQLVAIAESDGERIKPKKVFPIE
ncbi:MAG: tRNA pseudouridine(55) synthase TruB [Gemmatimonadota bacterium]